MRMFNYYKTELNGTSSIRRVGDIVGFKIFNDSYIYEESVSSAAELSDKIREADPNGKFDYQAVYYNSSTHTYSFLAGRIGVMKMIVLEDSGNNRVPNTEVSAKIDDQLISICTTSSAGICHAVAPFGNSTFVITDKNANEDNKERSVIIDF